MENNVFSLLIQHMEDEKAVLLSVLIAGSPKDYADYQNICGKVYGLSIAQRIVGEMKERFKDNDD